MKSNINQKSLRLALLAFIAALVLRGQLHAQQNQPPASQARMGTIEKFIVHSSSQLNRDIPFYVRIPATFQEDKRLRRYRVLFVCPFFNEDGMDALRGNSGFFNIADQRGWFIVCPTFKQNKEDVQNRQLSYYYPETFSGKAVLDALELIKQKYPIETDGLLLYGLSGGAQFVHRFAIWAPDRVTAVIINSSSWFDDPTPRAAQIPWLVTVGEADPSFDNTLEFVIKIEAAGGCPIFRSYPGMTHFRAIAIPPLDVEFFKYYDDLTHVKLEGSFVGQDHVQISNKDMPFIGDKQTWQYVKKTPEAEKAIDETNRVYFPNEEIAKQWTAVTN